MHLNPSYFEIAITELLGYSAQRRVFIGFASAELLHRISFSDVLDEDTRKDYQRRFNPQHSLDFRNYIQRDNSTTIPLTFNLRPCSKDEWQLNELPDNLAVLKI